MKRITTLFLMVVLVSTLSMAQNQKRQPRDPAQDAKKLTQIMKDSLNLTADQLPKVDKLNTEYAQKQADIMKNASPNGDRAAMMEKMKALRTEKDGKLKTILTADQLNKWESMQKNMHQRQGDKKGGEGNKGDKKPGGRGEGRGTGTVD